MSTTTPSQRIALVTGARGGIGRALLDRLRADGHRVAAVGRDGVTLADLPADARIAADTTTPEGAERPTDPPHGGAADPPRLTLDSGRVAATLGNDGRAAIKPGP